MKTKLSSLSEHYLEALRKYLKAGPRASLKPALVLGRQAVDLGLRTLEMARIHEGALTTLESSKCGIEQIKRGEMFFTEALAPIVETLSRRTSQLTATNRQLHRSLKRRKDVEAALKQSGKHYARLLKESLKLQEGVRLLTHQVLAAQEEERRKISRELQDEIAQTLLGINVRLISLKKEGRGKGFKNEIASTQRLVVRSAESMRRVVLKLDIPKQA